MKRAIYHQVLRPDRQDPLHILKFNAVADEFFELLIQVVVATWLDALIEIDLLDGSFTFRAEGNLDDLFKSLVGIDVLERGDLLLEHIIVVNSEVLRLTSANLEDRSELCLVRNLPLDVVMLAEPQHLIALPPIPVLVIVQEAAHC